MIQPRDIVRSKVDEIRAATFARDRAQVLQALATTVQADKFAEDRGERSIIHMCPWHTCQATRHG